MEGRKERRRKGGWKEERVEGGRKEGWKDGSMEGRIRKDIE